jgi:2-polyprenyl-6-methoxyphenol hydroxylase-like FAD-dependent oxidoreductase
LAAANRPGASAVVADPSRRALIIGAGPGGLTAAIALSRVGIETTVFEREPKVGVVGGGLGVQSNALRALMRLGIGERLIQAGSEIRLNKIHNREGRFLFELPQGEVGDAFGTPTIMVLRADVQLALVDALEDGVLKLGAEFVSVEQQVDGVTAHFADGRSERGALLIGADGARSVTRKFVYGDAGKPLRYAGQATWRGVADMDRTILPDATAMYYNGPGVQFVMFPVGGQRIYWGVMRTEPEGGSDPPGQVHQRLAEYLEGFPAAAREVVDATAEAKISRTDLYDRDPSKTWVKGRVVLLGDAAHVTTPFIGQGAGISMEDSIVLAKELALTDGLRDQRLLDVALAAYQRVRVPRCAQVVLTSRRRGRIYLMRNPVLGAVRDEFLSHLPHRVTRSMVERSIVYEP